MENEERERRERERERVKRTLEKKTDEIA